MPQILTAAEREIPMAELSAAPAVLNAEADATRSFTWWLPDGAEAFVLPLSAGVEVAAKEVNQQHWLKVGSPWGLTDLPVLGARYGERTLVVIVPWPHYAELVVAERLGVRFQFPEGRANVTPCQIVAQWSDADSLAAARVFRNWRAATADTGAIPKPRPLPAKAKALPAVTNLFGASHFYLWGPALFSHHDVPRTNWIAVARSFRDAKDDSFAARVVASFSAPQREQLRQLAAADWPEAWLTLEVATAINDALTQRTLLALPAELPLARVVQTNSRALAGAMKEFVANPSTWGDGFSLPMLEALQSAGIDRALLLLSDLYREAPRPDVATRAAQLGYLLGPYDSYHSVHDPAAPADTTWETAQFDRIAYEQGRVHNADGSGHRGFKGRGYHFAPAAAWPYVRQRVQSHLTQTPFSAWFVDCDATAECFDDFNPLHPATRVADIQKRRERLRWLETEQRLVVGSEGGAALFADVIHFGHGIQTPYIGHLAREFKTANSPSFLGKHWPPDSPAVFFQTARTPRSLVTPYFDPQVRIPLYQAALGDEVVVSHHWNFDSLKLNDVQGDRELLELLYLVPPLYHVNRETWPKRRAAIVRHFKFWSPLHRELAGAPLTRFECLTPDRLLQRTTFQAATGAVTVTVNFHDQSVLNYPPRSASVTGPIAIFETVYRLSGE